MMNCKRLFCLALAAFLLIALPVAAFAEPIDTRTLATINKPGTVLVLTTWTADMRLHEFSLEDSMMDDIGNEVARMIRAGEIPGDDATIYSVIIQLMAANMHNYAFHTGNVTDKRVSTWGMGSGFIVTPDGYLVTNAHVVQGDEDELYRYFAISNLQEQADADISGVLAELRRGGYNPSQEELDALYDAYFNLLAQSFELSNLQTSFDCVLGNVTPGSDISIKGIGMDLRKIGEPYPGKDIAILKIDGQTNLPTVTLGDDTKMKTGDRVYAMGYPGAATLHDSIDLNQSMQEPTLTQGILSAKKQMAGGWGILQMDAAIHYGNSGGPLFNEAGEVIGINTFGSVDDSSGSLVGGMNFAVPISIAKQFLNEINVAPTESTFTTNFKKALAAYNEGDYKTSIDLLHGINDTNPGFPVVQELLAEARQAHDANPQPDETPSATDVSDTQNAGQNSKGVIEAFSPVDNKASGQSDTILGLPSVAVYVGIGVIVVALALVLILVLRKKKPAMAAGMPSYAMPPPQPIKQFQPNQPVFTMSGVAITCPGCGAGLAPDARFCDNCGQPVEKLSPGACPQCGAPLNPGAKFCAGCGAKTS